MVRGAIMHKRLKPTNVLKCFPGTCQIIIDVVDPTDAGYDIVPNEFRGMAGWVIQQCVESAPLVGGFVTRNISNVINYLRLPTATLRPDTWRKILPFIT